MDEIKIRPDKISVGGNIKRIRTAKHIRAYDLIRDLQLEASTSTNRDTIN